MKPTFVKVELSSAPKFRNGMVCQCNTCGSVFALQPKEDYCPICKYYNLNRDYKQIIVKDEFTIGYMIACGTLAMPHCEDMSPQQLIEAGGYTKADVMQLQDPDRKNILRNWI